MQKLSTLLFAIVGSGCSFYNDSGDTGRSCRALTTTQASPMPSFNGSVFTIVMENHSYGDIIGSEDAPYINSIAKQYAVAKGFHDPYVHPSEPNYIWMTSGENFDILDDDDPSPNHRVVSTSHIADQLELADLTWRSYQEGMGSACGLVSHGRYAAKHDPFVFYDDINGWDGKQFNPSPRCTEHVLDYSQLDADIAANALPKYAFITPNLDDDMHDGSVSQGDTWLSHELPKILATKAFQDGGVVFLLWDEGSFDLLNGGIQDDPPFIAISPLMKPGFVSPTAYDTSSYLETVAARRSSASICSPAFEPQAGSAVPLMADLFTVPMPVPQ